MNVQNIDRLYALSRRNVILRYKNSIAGFLWGFLKPLIYLLIFIIVFSTQFTTINHYVLYATSGLIFWFFFANVTNQTVGSIIGSAGLIKALDIPVMFFPLAEMISETFNLLLSLVVFFVAMYWFGIQYTPTQLLVLPAALLFACFTFGLTLLLSSLNVFFRDVGIIWTTVQPAVFYLTPIAYPESLIAGKYQFFLSLNPIYHFIKLARTIIYQAETPTAMQWGACLSIATGALVFGLFIFKTLKNQFISSI